MGSQLEYCSVPYCGGVADMKTISEPDFVLKPGSVSVMEYLCRPLSASYGTSVIRLPFLA